MFGLFGNKDNKILKKYVSVLEKINSFEPSMEKLSDNELRLKTDYFRNLLSEGKTLNDILPEAFAVVREGAKRVLNQRHYDVQMMGGITLHNAMIAEMLTGEGKTLVSTLSAYLNAMSGKGVHIVTVNDYLAERDGKWMGALFEFLGLKVGIVLAGMDFVARKQAYAADITYVTNNELGFDYLRDNMQIDKGNILQRPFHYAIIDEIDSVLIDEARTPLIISGASEESTQIYKLVNGIIRYFSEEDYILEEKDKTVNLTEIGLPKAEKFLKQAGILQKGSLFDLENIQLYHVLNQTLKAHLIFKKEVDYIVKDSQVMIVDEFTGRIMEGRRFSDGLHQALEAKENIRIKEENQTLASITFQNLFKMYPKLSGMTGTAKTEEKEFIEIYNLKVLSIPSNKQVARVDVNDQIYLSYQEKENAIVTKVIECNKVGQPVLIGTVSIENSEKLSKALTKAKIKHNVLNAKHNDKEAYIISQAGMIGAVTIATNMAGRGTDIQLGGNLEITLNSIPNFQSLDNVLRVEKENEIKETIAKDKQKILDLGGLCVIGTERHESRRIDNQLRGRSGRQGEQGISIFYVSLEDDLMRVFGSKKLEGVLKTMGFKEGESISHSMISKSIEKAQKKVEEYHFEARKNILRFDNVINEQRKLIYNQRRDILQGVTDLKDMIFANIEEVAEDTLDSHTPQDQYIEKWNYEGLDNDCIRLFAIHIDSQKLVENGLSREELLDKIIAQAKDNINLKEQELGDEIFVDITGRLILQIIDLMWKRNLHELDYVRGSINLRAYANKDPFNEYQKESFLLFSKMLQEIKSMLVTVICNLQYERKEEKSEPTKTSKNDLNTGKVGRNEPCPCGSGKKYKHCHG